MSTLWLWRVWLFRVLNLVCWALPLGPTSRHSHTHAHTSLSCGNLTVWPNKAGLKERAGVGAVPWECVSDCVEVCVCERLHLHAFRSSCPLWLLQSFAGRDEITHRGHRSDGDSDMLSSYCTMTHCLHWTAVAVCATTLGVQIFRLSLTVSPSILKILCIHLSLRKRMRHSSAESILAVNIMIDKVFICKPWWYSRQTLIKCLLWKYVINGDWKKASITIFLYISTHYHSKL